MALEVLAPNKLVKKSLVQGKTAEKADGAVILVCVSILIAAAVGDYSSLGIILHHSLMWLFFSNETAHSKVRILSVERVQIRTLYQVDFVKILNRVRMQHDPIGIRA